MQLLAVWSPQAHVCFFKMSLICAFNPCTLNACSYIAMGTTVPVSVFQLVFYSWVSPQLNGNGLLGRDRPLLALPIHKTPTAGCSKVR